MRKFLALAMVLCVASAASAQMQPLPLEGDWSYQPTARAGDPFMYLETTPSGFWAPISTWGAFGGVADEIHLNKPWTLTGFDVPYIARVSPNQLPLTATVNFYNMDAGENLLPGAIAAYTITGLGTSATYPPGSNSYSISAQKLAPVAMPADFWMEISITNNQGAIIAPDPVHTGVGFLLAGDDVSEANGLSHDFFAAMTTKGNVGGYFWFGGYTPNLPPSDPNYNPMSNFLLGINGIPEPMTLGLVALGGLLVVRRRR
jgi:hypothetical protein